MSDKINIDWKELEKLKAENIEKNKLTTNQERQFTEDQIKFICESFFFLTREQRTKYMKILDLNVSINHMYRLAQKLQAQGYTVQRP